ncbi:hypothetical protein B0H13DRAFT_2346534 [Mycena leptocephala]|nr:hypothetical protein B0H13DRAFT_2346534 [Mycena leptocephala]
MVAVFTVADAVQRINTWFKHSKSFWSLVGFQAEKLQPEVTTSFLQGILSSQIKTWYNNEITHIRQPEESKPSPTKVKMKQYNSESVVKEKHEERYQDIKEELSMGGTEWNDLYRATMKKLWDELDDEEQNKCSQISKERNAGNI